MSVCRCTACGNTEVFKAMSTTVNKVNIILKKGLIVGYEITHDDNPKIRIEEPYECLLCGCRTLEKVG